MRIRFLADADLNKKIVRGVLKQVPEIDFKVAPELKGLPDPQVLAYAAHEGRTLVTHDRRTMAVHFGEFIQIQNSPGVFIIAQKISVRRAIDELVLFWAASEAEEHINLIRNLFP